MKIVFKYIVAVFAFALLFVPLAFGYDNAMYDFSITPPAGWNIKENVQGVVVQFLGPSDPDVGAVNINVDVVDTSLTLAGVVSETKQEWASTLTSYVLISEGNLNVNGRNGYELEVEFRSGNSAIKQDTVLFVENGKLYQVNYVAGPSNYDRYFGDYVESLGTFQIKSPLFSFSFEIKGLSFLLLLVAVIVIVIVTVALLLRRRNKSKQQFVTPPIPPPQ
ncbi:MAG: PsbP-related protein [Candidatus Bathyarchaeia archaeon]